MSIRLKLTMVLSVLIGVTAALSSAWTLHLQRLSIATVEQEKTKALIDNVVRMAEESLLAKDPLMLVSYLEFIQKALPETGPCTIWNDGRRMDVHAGAPIEEGPPARAYDVREARTGPLRIQVRLRRAVLDRRLREALAASQEDAVRFGVVMVCLGLAIAILLAGSLTRRIASVAAALEVVGKGKWGTSIDPSGNDEVARLARVFNSMSQQLSELDEAKKTFVASVTHELRSPLGAISAQVRQALAEEPALGENVRKGLERIRDNAARLDHFVSNLLEMSKIEKGKLDFQPRKASVRQVLEDTSLFFRPRARELGLELVCQTPEDLPSAMIDPDLVTQVVANLISNGLKFTRPPGTIRVGAKRDGARIVCSVSDTGIGLSAEELERLFKPFERIRNPIKASGTGLGLAISKSIVEMHGGDIRAESKKGRGTQFFFSFPIDGPAKTPSR